MIVTTINNILNAAPVFNFLSTQKFKSGTSFQLARLIKALNKEIVLFEDAREKLVEKFCEKDKFGQRIILDNGTVKVQEGKIEECNKELKDLLEVQIEINANKIREEELEEAQLSPSQVMMILEFVE